MAPSAVFILSLVRISNEDVYVCVHVFVCVRNICSFHDIVFTWSVYDHLLMSPVKSTSISVDKGEETLIG